MDTKSVTSSASSEGLVDRYSTGMLSKDLPTELARLRALEACSDPTSMAMVDKLGLAADGRCLEMGAGAGSMAYWLAERCPAGRVVAADIDPRYLDAGRAPNLDIARVDLTKYDYPEACFDLIHARFLFSHLPAREELLQRAVAWLAPGGSILLEDFYVLPIEEIPGGPSRALVDGVKRALQLQGSDPQWARHIPSRFGQLGLVDLQATVNPILMGADHPSSEMWRLCLEQVIPFMLQKGLVTTEQVEAYQAQPNGACVVLPWVTISVSARQRKN